MKTAMESLKEMVDVNTVIGDPVETQDGQVIVPISKVAFGFAAGGGEYGGGSGGSGGGSGGGSSGGQGGAGGFPFGGGSGAGVSVQPVGFLIVSSAQIRLLPVDANSAMVDRLIDLAPKVLDKVQSMMGGGGGGGQSGNKPSIDKALENIEGNKGQEH